MNLALSVHVIFLIHCQVTRYVFSRDLSERASWHEPDHLKQDRSSPSSVRPCSWSLDDFEVPAHPFLLASGGTPAKVRAQTREQ